MTTTTDIRAAIKAKLESIPSIGKVHDYERFAKAEKDLIDFYRDQKRIQGWLIQRVGLRKTELSTGLYAVRSNWEVRGYLSLEDSAASELIFDALVDLVIASLSNDITFGKVASYFDGYEIKATVQPVMFCGVLCHSAIISFDTVHEETSTIDGLLNDFLTLQAQYDIKPFETTAEHEKWQEEPANYTTSRPELIETIKPQE